MAIGLTEEDLYGDGVREPLCTCCRQLAQALASLPPDSRLVEQSGQLKAAADNLKVAGAVRWLDMACCHVFHVLLAIHTAGTCRVAYLEV